MTCREVQDLLAICEQADDQDTGSLDAFREAATVGVVAELCESLLAQEEARRQIIADFEATEIKREANGEPRNYVAERLAGYALGEEPA